MNDDQIPEAVAAVLREAGERPWHVAFGEYYIEAQNREIVAKVYPGMTPDVDRAAAICWAVNHAQGWMDEVARWKRDFHDAHDAVLILAKQDQALQDAEEALADIARLPDFRSSGNGDNAGNRANLLAAKTYATKALATIRQVLK